MKIKHWIKLVKRAIKATRESDRAWQAYFVAEDKIHQRAPLFEIYNKEFKKGLGVNFCQLTYGMDKNLFDPLQNPNAHNCSCFTPNAKCPNKDCPAHAANNTYFEAKKALEEAIRIRKNANRRAFGLKIK